MKHKYHTNYLSTPTILFTSNPLTGESSPSMEESEQGVEKLLSEYCTDVSPSHPMEGSFNDNFSLISLRFKKVAYLFARYPAIIKFNNFLKKN